MFAFAQIMESTGLPVILSPAARGFAHQAKLETSQIISLNKLLFHMEKPDFNILAGCERSVNRYGN